MRKKLLALSLSLILIISIFSGTTASASSVYYDANNYLVAKTDELETNEIAEQFSLAKSKGTGVSFILDYAKISFSASYVQNSTPVLSYLRVKDSTTVEQQNKNIKQYTVSGITSGLLKTNHNGNVEITLPYNSQNKNPMAYCKNANNEIFPLYLTYNDTDKTVTIRADYFGDFYIYDATGNDFNYGKFTLSLLDNSEEYLYLYETIENCIINFEEQVTFDSKYNVTVSELATVYNAFKNDHPERFEMMIDNQGNNYLTPYGYSWDGVDKVYSFFPKYYITKDEYNFYMAEIEEKANKLIEDIDVSKIGEYEASKIVYERLCENIDYVLDAPYCHTIYGSLVNGASVCDGYAKAYQFLLNKLGIIAHTVSGNSYNPTTGVGEAHAWTLVRINGEYYYSDVTWADQTKVFYSYLNCDYSTITKDHQFANPGYSIPESSATKDNYFTITGYELDYEDINTNNIIKLIQKQGPVIQFKINNYQGSDLLNDVFAKFNADNQNIMRGILNELGYNSLRVSAYFLGSEIVFNFYNTSLTDIPNCLSVSGDMVVGKTLTVTSGSYTDVLEKVIWYRNGLKIANASGKNYKLTVLDIDSYISVGAYSSKYNYFTCYVSKTRVSNIPSISGNLTISGNKTVGSKLTALASLNVYDNLSYQWYKNGSAISGATNSSYTLTSNDIGADIYCTVTSSAALGELQSNVISNITSGEFVPGDVSGDDECNSKDLTALRRYLADWNVTVNIAALDINKDTEINGKDVTYLARYLADWTGYIVA